MGNVLTGLAKLVAACMIPYVFPQFCCMVMYISDNIHNRE